MEEPRISPNKKTGCAYCFEPDLQMLKEEPRYEDLVKKYQEAVGDPADNGK